MIPRVPLPMQIREKNIVTPLLNFYANIFIFFALYTDVDICIP